MAVETPEYLDMVTRLVKRAGVRVGDADEAELKQLVALRDVLEEAIRVGIQGQRETTGRSWAHIGAALGITRQSAQERYGRYAAGTWACHLCAERSGTITDRSEAEAALAAHLTTAHGVA